MPHYNPTNIPASHISQLAEGPLVETKIEDGKLLYERRWYHRGQPIYVEGKDISKFAAHISAIGTEAVSVKKIHIKYSLKTVNYKICLFISRFG